MRGVVELLLRLLDDGSDNMVRERDEDFLWVSFIVFFGVWDKGWKI